MSDYISREAVLQAVLELPPKMDEQGYGWLGRRGVWQMVSDFPAADVRPVVRGTWVGIDDFPHEDWECDHCGCVVGNTDDPWNYYHFCPNCGARMEES